MSAILLAWLANKLLNSLFMLEPLEPLMSLPVVSCYTLRRFGTVFWLLGAGRLNEGSNGILLRMASGQRMSYTSRCQSRCQLSRVCMQIARLMFVKESFVIIVYIFSVVGSIIFGIQQLRFYQQLDEQNDARLHFFEFVWPSRHLILLRYSDPDVSKNHVVSTLQVSRGHNEGLCGDYFRFAKFSWNRTGWTRAQGEHEQFELILAKYIQTGCGPGGSFPMLPVFFEAIDMIDDLGSEGDRLGDGARLAKEVSGLRVTHCDTEHILIYTEHIEPIKTY